MPSEETQIAVLQTEMKNIVKGFDLLNSKVDSLTEKIDNHYVKNDDFLPVKRQVDSLRMFKVQVITIASVVGALIDIVLRLITKGN